MPIPDLKDLWRQGQGCINGWCSIPSTVTAEIAALQPFDTLTVDLQHGLIDYQTALAMLQAMGASGAPKLARTRWNEPGLIMALLDAGFVGIICPMVNSRAEAEAFVASCRYAPQGARSFGPTRAALVHGADYAQHANEKVTRIAMIETRAAIEALDDILAVDGIDAVYIGPADLSLSLGYTPSLAPTDSEVLDAIDTIRDRAKAAGRFACIHCGSPDVVRDRLAGGFDLASMSTDTRILSAALADRLDAARPGPVEGAKAVY